MRRDLPPLSALRAFEAAARLGSFKDAASELGVTPTAISHQIRTLEEHMGLALFERRTRKVLLTEAGEQLFPALRDGFDGFAEAVAAVTERKSRARVTITATRAFTARWLLPRLARFTRRHPDVDLQLHASDQAVDLERGGIDLAVRYGRGPYPGFIAEVLFADDFAVVANPLLRLKKVSDLATIPRISFQWRRKHAENPTWEKWFSAAGITRPPRAQELLLSDESDAIQAAVAGQGAALLGVALVADELAAGRLRRPFGPTLPGHTYHLLRRASSPSVDAAASWLKSEANASTPRG